MGVATGLLEGAERQNRRKLGGVLRGRREYAGMEVVVGEATSRREMSLELVKVKRSAGGVV